MRRKDREMARDFAERVIDDAEFATMGTMDPNGKPYCVTLSMVRDGERLYFHCAQEGEKLDCIRQNRDVCVSFVGRTRIPDGKFTIYFESAVVFGTAEEVIDESEKIHALRLICKRFTPNNMENFDDEITKALRITSVWKIYIDKITGKRNG
ncbi:MAG: pyridoxamine 5'-phosphate oxidase family protein [Treponema sp.]|jgi:nitroimidazol reductase NimA-like FMN-containing flavoprotein (pyridoxamine 5'-phosphate oxidase superfamily)|nr:pyridoxamine 5'-phosphate oxidase family protein [Treponema sp.]